jgi:hypothetical protein
MNNKVFEFLNRPSTKLERNGFDRSFRSIFSLKAGQIVPCFALETVSDGYYEIDPVDFIRTQPFNEANFVRMKQHMDFFFVPYSAIYRSWQSFYQQTSDPYSAQVASSVSPDIGDQYFVTCPSYSLFGLILAIMKASAYDRGQGIAFETWITNISSGDNPSISISTTIGYVMDMFLDSGESDGIKKDLQGYPFYQGTIRLLDMLGYGNFLPLSKIDFTIMNTPSSDSDLLTYKTNVVRFLAAYQNKMVNVWRLAAYQCVCENFYTNTHYVKPDVSRYNFDDCTSQNNAIYSRRSDFGVSLFGLNYAPWRYDYFTGSLPSPQFGAVSLLSSNSVLLTTSGSAPGSSQAIYAKPSGVSPSNVANSAGSTAYVIKNDIDVMDLKRAEALQAWKIAIGRAGYRASDRFDATFGVRPEFSPDILPVRLGSIDGDIMKDVVTGTAGDEFAQTAATGTSTLNSRKITLATKDFGVIIGVMRIIPVAEYDSYQVDAVNTKLEPFDYFTPKFQDLGLQPVKAHELSIFGTGLTGIENVIGYTPRYAEYKIGVDRVHGEFCTQPVLFPIGFSGTDPIQEETSSLEHYVSSRMDIETWQGDVKQFFVDPAVLNHIFFDAADADQKSDQFHVNTFFDVRCVQPMSVLGLPQFNN